MGDFCYGATKRLATYAKISVGNDPSSVSGTGAAKGARIPPLPLPANFDRPAGVGEADGISIAAPPPQKNTVEAVQ